ncbi:DUF1365 domain-containing protein [Frigidibacter mobilis]|uniref:Cyclopropane-fatty-acyl-phospholipid synthase n=1 Tax=Frigidibacter mobilis TaxID=1335048 RepID=A0A165SV08_9RHOB|nr:DUF1365 domain-containing protein [Frigidibacter mobilis]AMY71393.1 hypothetical protein AKL17_4178 [Frigidibacter mobilis]
MSLVEHVRGRTYHARHGGPPNAFRYGIDYVLLEDAEAPVTGLRLFSRNRRNIASVQDRDHGGAPGQGRGAAWLREVLAAEGVQVPGLRIGLLAQPRLLGHVFNPVSFWLCRDGEGALRAVVAEVTNTFGDRHSYLCLRPGLEPIRPEDEMLARKVFHVSPFQDVAGEYRFRFDIGAARVGVWIDYRNGKGGVLATLTGRRGPLTDAGLLGALLRRPFGSRRVLALIHWQALKLFVKGARYRDRPLPPPEEATR